MSPIDPHSYADPSQGTIKHLKLTIAADFSMRVLRIQAHYDFDRPVTGELFLDCRGLTIQSASAGGRKVGFSVDKSDPVLGERLCIESLGGATALLLEVTTSPHAKALQWLEPHQTAGGQLPFLYSQCQCLHARSIFPCQDTPSVRFSYEAHLQVPRGLTAVMAAAPVERITQGDIETFSFRMPQPIPSYLFAMAAGSLQFRSLDLRTGIYAEPQILEAAAWEFAENEQKLAEAEKLFGPYLWDRYDVLIMPPSFPFNGMENPRLTFATPLLVLGDRSGTTVISHEIAHAWTGNLVTNATWEDFWLNEGFTTYAQGRINERIEGRDIAQLLDHARYATLLADIKAFGSDSPHTALKDSLQGIDPDDVFSRVPYVKGSLFVKSLEDAVGREAFDRFLRDYTSHFAFSSLTTEQFVEFLRDRLPHSLDVVDVHGWLYRRGMPPTTPTFESPLIEAVTERIAAYQQGSLPANGEMQRWDPNQKGLFLELLPPKVPPDDCGRIERALGLTDSRDQFLLFLLYRLALASGYQAAMPGIRRFTESVGSLYMLTRLIRSMVEEDWARPLARPIFQNTRAKYHPIVANSIEAILLEAGL